jgi:hypothetical protein
MRGVRGNGDVGRCYCRRRICVRVAVATIGYPGGDADGEEMLMLMPLLMPLQTPI